MLACAPTDAPVCAPHMPPASGILGRTPTDDQTRNSEGTRERAGRLCTLPTLDVVPERGIEPPTFSLRMSCSTD